MAQSERSTKRQRGFRAHWVFTLPILLAVAALSIRQINLYPPTADEFFSLFNVGWLGNGPFTSVDVLTSLAEFSPNQTPGYFVLLNLWGHFTGNDVASGRVLSIFVSLLALALVYRLARDFVAPLSGLFAVIILASNAFYNFYIPHLRMYPLLLLSSALTLWLYLRIVHKLGTVRCFDYLSLGLACYVLANSHAWSLLFFLMLGLYHLLAVRKDRRWLMTATVIATALLLFLPWAPILLSSRENVSSFWASSVTDGAGATSTWLAAASNNSPYLLLVGLLGIEFARWTQNPVTKALIFLPLLFLLVLFAVAQISGLILYNGMRYALTGFVPFVLLAAWCHFALYRRRKWLALLVLLWLPAATHFQATANWGDYVAGRIYSFDLPPWQALSRDLRQSADTGPLIAYRVEPNLFDYHGPIGVTQRQYFFSHHDTVVKIIRDLLQLEEYVRSHTIAERSFWLLYQTSKVDAAAVDETEALLNSLSYEACEVSENGVDSILTRYSWKTLNCQPPTLVTKQISNLTDYEFFGARLDVEEGKVLFVDKWTARVEFDLDRYVMSLQLISDTWSNEAQVDLPLVHESDLRQFSIDIINMPAGTYRLMAILYDRRTGERVDWIDNPGYVPGMMELAEVVIPE